MVVLYPSLVSSQIFTLWPSQIILYFCLRSGSILGKTDIRQLPRKKGREKQKQKAKKKNGVGGVIRKEAFRKGGEREIYLFKMKK